MNVQFWRNATTIFREAWVLLSLGYFVGAGVGWLLGDRYGNRDSVWDNILNTLFYYGLTLIGVFCLIVVISFFVVRGRLSGRSDT